MYSAPSPFDEPTAPIDTQALRAWWAHQRHDTQPFARHKPERIAFTRQRYGREEPARRYRRA